MATERIQTYCAMCISRCGVVATVEDGQFSKVSVDPEHPNGCICIKGTAAPEIVYSQDRLQYPVKRTRPKGEPDPGWERVSWDEALAIATYRLTEIKNTHGPEAVVFGTATTAGTAMIDVKPWLERLVNAFGSPNFLVPNHVCTWNGRTGSKHTYGVSWPAIDFDHANCILLWGANPQATQPASAMRISKAQKRGAKLIVVDPRQHALARKADCWLRVRPGSDGALALALIHVLFDEDLYDEAFVRDWTNGPFLMREDTKVLLSATDLPASGDTEGFVVWDSLRNRPVAWRRDDEYGRNDVDPALWGRFECELADGSRVHCRTVVDSLKELAAAYTPEESSEITWVAPDEVRKAARMFATEQPSAYESFTGTEMHTGAMQMNRAIHCFYGLTGQFDGQGSNVTFATTPTHAIHGRELLPDDKRELRLGLADHPLGPPRDPGIVQHSNVYRAILDGKPYPVKAMVLFGTDILVGHIDPVRGKRALEALDFHVQVDIVESPTATFADLLLPACTTWECEAVGPTFPGGADTNNWNQIKKAVIPQLHESRPDLEIVFDLAQGLDLGEHFFDGDIDAAWNYYLEPAGVTVTQLRAHPVGIRSNARTRYRKYAEIDPVSGRLRGFPTVSGRLELYATPFHAAGYAPLPEYKEPVESPLNDSEPLYPLVLTSFRSIQFIGPQYRNIPRLRSQLRDPLMELHPDTALAAGIQDGDWAILENATGRVRLKARFNQSLHPRVICAPYGWWQGCKELDLPGYDPLGPNGANVNLLISDKDIDPISGSVPHRSSMCRVAALLQS